MSFIVSHNMTVESTVSSSPMVFIHGNLASRHWWLPVINALSATDVTPFAESAVNNRQPSTALLLEWCGHGDAAPPRQIEDLNIKNLAKQAIQHIDDRIQEPYYLIGHSTGGLIAVLMAALSPGQIKGVIALDPVGAKGVVLNPSISSAFEKMMSDPKLTAQMIGATIYNLQPADSFFNEIIAPMAFRAARQNKDWVLQNLSHVDFTEELRSVSCPALILHGEHDLLLPKQDSQQLAEIIPNGIFQEIPDQGHCCNYENPEKLADLITNFFS